MEFILLFCCVAIVLIAAYQIPFATDNPMGTEINESLLFLVKKVDLKNDIIIGKFSIDGYVKRHIHPKLITLLDNYQIPISGNTKGIKSKIKSSNDIIWISNFDVKSFNNDLKLFNLEGEMIN